MISKFHVAVGKCADHCRQSESPGAALDEIGNRMRDEGWDTSDVERLIAAIRNLALVCEASTLC
jgi:hypothetical protein